MRFKITIPLTQYLEMDEELKEGQILEYIYGSVRKDPKVTAGKEMALEEIMSRRHLFQLEVYVKIVD